VEKLKKIGIEHIVLITGDNQQSADKVAEKLGMRKFTLIYCPKIS